MFSLGRVIAFTREEVGVNKLIPPIVFVFFSSLANGYLRLVLASIRSP